MPKGLEILEDFEDVTPEPRPALECRRALYSPNGEFLAYTQPHQVVVYTTSSAASIHWQIEVAEVAHLFFSNSGTYLCTWSRPVLISKEDGTYTKNVRIFNVKTKSLVTEWSEKREAGWTPQFTLDELLLVKGAANNKEIHFFDIHEDNATSFNVNLPNYRFKVLDPKCPYKLFMVSPGLNPLVAVFMPVYSGQPAQVVIYNVPNFAQPVCQRSFFNADSCQMKWNSLGTSLLVLALTDHDKTNQSYYGDSNLFLLGIAGNYDSRIALTREGPIHDITWLPTSREFAVVYGYMPAETTFFDARGNATHSLGTEARNTVLYSPHARFVLLAGFGNLQGKVDVYDRQNKFAKITTIDASNTSVCEWLPCGRFILTATTAPRLRVDNGFKVWHASGQLCFLKEYSELHAIGWRPQPISDFPHLKTLEAAPEPHHLTHEHALKKKALLEAAAAKPKGAYRPPHARNGTASSEASSLYQKELLLQQQQLRSDAKNGINPVSGRARVVPGAGPAPLAPETKAAAKNRKKREAKLAAVQNDLREASPAPSAPSTPVVSSEKPAAETEDAGRVEGGIVSLEDKKIRALLKKLRAIEALKMKQASGEKLENTQVSKMQKEDEIRGELNQLGWDE